MITQAELNKKAKRPWVSGAFLKSWLNDEPFFPFEIPFKTPTGRTLSNEFIQVREWISELSLHSKAVKGVGYQLEYRSINHQTLGGQELPQKIFFDNQDDWLAFTGHQSDFKQFVKLVGLTRRQLPEIMPFISGKPMKVLDFADVWPLLIKVCRYFQLKPKPGRYIRQLDIQDVDTKFIEMHKGILSDLLTLALESEDFDAEVTGLSENGFERRFGLLFDEPLIRFRLLDSQVRVTDMSVPLSQFIDPRVSRIFITENKINGLAFPPLEDSIVIFGLGYGVRSLFSVDWLKTKEIYYWGDIDTHGFAILSQLRQRFHQVESFLMDQETLDKHFSLCVEEPEGKRFLGELFNLADSERSLFDALKNNAQGNNLRLEQERIGYGCLREALKGCQ
ncbi:hypothetical protein ACH42_03505 [Endozoicomonas sp. (ex Bugula neritina AB1)]|nr:hypothetical protein ACH42_03505 [Endozoicomonas sp. (ex Bugula neritina AB1)]